MRLKGNTRHGSDQRRTPTAIVVTKLQAIEMRSGFLVAGGVLP